MDATAISSRQSCSPTWQARGGPLLQSAKQRVRQPPGVAPLARERTEPRLRGTPFGLFARNSLYSRRFWGLAFCDRGTNNHGSTARRQPGRGVEAEFYFLDAAGSASAGGRMPGNAWYASTVR